MVAEWNIRQEEIEEAHHRAALARWRSSPRSSRGPAPVPPSRRARPQSPRMAAAALAHAKQQVKGPPDALAFWCGSGLLHVS